MSWNDTDIIPEPRPRSAQCFVDEHKETRKNLEKVNTWTSGSFEKQLFKFHPNEKSFGKTHNAEDADWLAKRLNYAADLEAEIEAWMQKVKDEKEQGWNMASHTLAISCQQLWDSYKKLKESEE